jgi:hypothetical protein
LGPFAIAAVREPSTGCEPAQSEASAREPLSVGELLHAGLAAALALAVC